MEDNQALERFRERVGDSEADLARFLPGAPRLRQVERLQYIFMVLGVSLEHEWLVPKFNLGTRSRNTK